MTRDDRLDLIDELQRKADEHRAEIERRQEARERDPALMDDFLRSEREAAAEPIGGAPVSAAPDAGILHRDYYAAASPEPEPSAPAPSYDDLTYAIGRVVSELRREYRKKIGRLETEMKALRREVDAHTASEIEVYCSGVEKRLSMLEGENIRLKAMLESRGRRR